MSVSELLEARLQNPIIRSALLLGLFAVIGTAVVASVHLSTQARIAENQRELLLRSLNAILPETTYDNDILNDTVRVADKALGSRGPMTVYLASKGGAPQGAVLTAVAPDGYSGPIRLLVGVRYDGTLSGVRVVSHRETPGLGDRIDIRRSDWVLGFNERAIGNPPMKRWAVKRDGGDFDQFTGATITPRAVVAAVRRALVYFNKHKDALFAGAPLQSENRGASAALLKE